MAKTLSSVIGVDIGRYALKSVLLQKKGGDRFAVTHFASHIFETVQNRTRDHLIQDLKALMKSLGGKAKACAVAVSSPDALVRLIDQPETPIEILRDALKLNGVSVLNQDCRNYVLDCDEVPCPASGDMQPGQKRYLVAGLPKEQVDDIQSTLESSGMSNVASLQLAPLSIFNAFEFAQPEAFANQAFFLLDLGHTTSTMILGARREIVLLRNIDFGGQNLLEAICSLSGENANTVLRALDQDDEIMIENARLCLMALTREIGSSIGFFEGRRDDTITKVWVSGGLAKNKPILRVLAEELQMPCIAWAAAERCEIHVGSAKRDRFTEEMLDYSVACGAAAQLLKS